MAINSSSPGLMTGPTLKATASYLEEVKVTKLKTDDNKYKGGVGPSFQYDFMGATQFRLLCTLGLRENHSLLDFGCGSLRAGRLFITYLDGGRYFGIEPNKWLLNEGIKNQLGKDLIGIKKPRFNHNGDFLTDVFSQQFDFILAQSIFSHTGRELIRPALCNFSTSLKPNGLIVVSFKEGTCDFDGSGWVGPKPIRYRRSTIERFAKEAGFSIIRIPWYHPRLTWYLMAKDKSRLPTRKMMRHLTGAVLFNPEFMRSWNPSIKSILRKIIPQTIRTGLKQLLRIDQ